MTERVQKALDELRTHKYREQRVTSDDFDMTEELKGESPKLIHTRILEKMLESENPYFLQNDIFGFNRKNTITPYYYKDEKKQVDFGGNITPNYRRVIEQGFDAVLAQIQEYSKNANDSQKLFYEAMRRDVVASLDICDRYRDAARKAGKFELADALEWIPLKPARSFYEACVFMKIIIYTIRCGGFGHITLGRFDQYMYSYYLEDVKNGATREEILEMLEMFFISLNLDGDIYLGEAQGDNGQSMVLGGYDKDGNDMFNELSSLCMDASLELALIDPKINLRVSKKTPDWLYDYGTKLTKQGLGFPQYCNDDIIIPALIELGYDEDDAWDYTVAACWEGIAPNCGYDVPNIRALSFPDAVNNAIQNHLLDCDTFEDMLSYVCEAIAEDCKIHISECAVQPTPNSRYLSLYIDGCLEKGLDFTEGGAKYNNFGCHGVGISNAADALAALKKTVFEDKTVAPAELLAALDANFEGYEQLRNMLLACPKMGNNDDYVDGLASVIMDAFVENLNGKPTGVFNGVWRAGTGSGMDYYRAAQKCPATADGRFDGDFFGCSFSPAVTTKINGPLSVIQSFTKYDLAKICNGGPLTMEIHDTVFRNEEGEKKVAALVKTFVHLGGHQLQLNSINRDRLLEAQAAPEKCPNLIVRVWGWSGYFCELKKGYQDHIIRRTEFIV